MSTQLFYSGLFTVKLAQDFVCRLCAVFGGVYCLRQRIDCLLMNKDTSKLSGIMCSNGQRIETS